MALPAVLLTVFLMLLFSSLKGIPILYPLLAGLVPVGLLALRGGTGLRALGLMMLSGVRRTSRIYEITLLVGGSAALWMACGTVPYLILHGLRVITPAYFVFSVFLITSLLALAIGSAFGTTGIIGVVFMVMARAGGVDPLLTAGAVLTAAYFCERSTPLSSCANLVSVISGADLYRYLKGLFLDTLVPLGVTGGLYLFFSLKNPLSASNLDVPTALGALFSFSPLVLLPAAAVAVCVALRLDVRLTLGLSILAAAAVAVLQQQMSPLETLETLLTGYRPALQTPLGANLTNGGLAGMVRPVMVIAVASAYSGIFEGTGMLAALETSVAQLVQRYGRFSGALVTGVVSACFGCSQTFAIISTHQFLSPYYEKTESGRAQLARDIGNAAVLTPALIPWNVAFTIPAAILAVDARCLPYAFFLYLAPLYMWGRSIVKTGRKG